jgi:asparagine synthase (glutamine-hydrolysing)
VTPAFEKIFAGQLEVALIHSVDSFVPYPTDDPDITCYLAGSYAQQMHPGCVSANNVADLFGQFVLLRHNARTRTLTILNDRFGLFPLFIARDGGRLFLCSEFHILASRLGGQASPDYEALSDILAFNVPFNRRTASSRIESLGGGLEVTIDLDTLSMQSRKVWNAVALLGQADLNFEDVKDTLVDLYLEGVALAVGSEQVRVTLSGGADSRCLLAASLHLGKSTTTYSTGVEGSRALSYASDMAEKCGVPHRVRPLDEHFVKALPSLMAQSSKTMQGMSFSSEVEAMWLRQQMEPGGVLLHGAFGELYKIGQMHQYPFDAAIASKKGAAVSDRLWKRFENTYQLRKQAFHGEYRLALGDHARQHLGDKVNHYGKELDTAGVLQMIYIDEFIGKVVKSSWQMWRQRISTVFPFAYPPLVDLILRVRPEQKTANGFVVHLLKRTNKKLGRYPDSNTGVKIGASWLRREMMHVFDYATKRLSSHRRCFDHQDFAYWLSRTPGGMEALFNKFNEGSGALDMEHLARLIRDCRAGNDAAARSLFFIWGWSLSSMDGTFGSAGPISIPVASLPYDDVAALSYV